MTKLFAAAWFSVSLSLSANVYAGDVEDGIAAYARGDSGAALRLFTQAAARGDATAQFNLGVAYANGLGVARNDPKAVVWYTKSANQGYVDAENNLGNFRSPDIAQFYG